MTQPIRVLQVVTHMNRGGLETMLMNYYRHIDRNQVQFDFLTHRQKRGDYDSEIEALGGTIYHLPRLIPWSRSYKKALDNFFKAHPEYQIIHVHQDCLSSVVLKVAKYNNIPVRIAHSHSSSQDKDYKYPIKLYYKRSIPRYATELFACGKEAGNWMFGDVPFAIMNNAINTSAFRFDLQRAMCVRRSLGISEDALVIGHVGRFSHPKNHTFLIDIFSKVHSMEPNSYLLLVGDGDLRLKIEKKVRFLGLEKSVIFTGLRSDVPDLMQVMDVFVFPSLYEGLPFTMVEAQASGLPCVISANIPVDCDLTDLVSRISLNEPIAVWAESILTVKDATPRRNTYAEIATSGFDISENVKWLEKYYLQRMDDV